MNKQKISILVLIFVVFSTEIYSQKINSDSANQAELESILKKCADYCEKLNQVALYFVCTEKVQERIFYPFKNKALLGISRKLKTEENNYIYDYQLIRKGKIKESRILLEENGKSLHIEEAPQKTKRFYYRNIIFGPIGLFSIDAQKLHDYIIEEETKLWGKPIVIVKALPKKPEESEQLYGKAWLDKKDGSILKIEWEETSIENYTAMKEFAKNIQGRPSLKFISEYRFEKNGIRFPNRCYMKEDYIGKGVVGAGFVLLEKSELIIEYKDYKFFIVETEVKY